MGVIIYRQSKGGAYRVLLDGKPTGKPYMSREQAERAAVKATGCKPWQILHLPDPERGARQRTATDALGLASAMTHLA